MKINLQLLSAFVFFFLAIQLSAQKGTIVAKKLDYDNPGNLPESGLKAFKTPNGEEIGQIYSGGFDYVFLVQGQDTVEVKGIKRIGYEFTALSFTRKEGAFIQTSNGFWLAENEIKDKGFKLVSIADEIMSNRVWYAKGRIQVMSEANKNTEVMATASGDLWVIDPIERGENGWFKVKVDQYEIEPCEGGDAIKSFTGWAKLIDDSGNAVVFQYPGGC